SFKGTLVELGQHALQVELPLAIETTHFNNPFHTLNPVNYHKIRPTGLIVPVNTQMCCSNKQQHSVFLPVRYHLHISIKIPVNSVMSHMFMVNNL
ncbi:MAG: hypothetical protein ACRCZO_13945, partial [Cetobacterium sp.]